MGDISERAIILQVFPYSDSSRILKLLCESHGVRTVIAKGASNPGSRFGGILEPFTEGEVRFRVKEGREMHTLAGFDLTRSRLALGRNLIAFAGASLLAEMTLRYATDEAQPELFVLVTEALDALMVAEPESVRGVALGTVWRLISLLGFEPRLEACVRCDRDIGGGEVTRFDLEAGGVVCTTCRPVGRLVDAQTRAEVAGMLGGAPPTVEADWRLHRALVHAFVATHLMQEHRLRSLDFFVDLLG